MADSSGPLPREETIARYQAVKEVIVVLGALLPVWGSDAALNPEDIRPMLERDPRRVDALLMIALAALTEDGHGRRTLLGFARMADDIIEMESRP